MSTIKYTSDGKKVAVIGKLNAEQTIVQEIFISGGQEIPSGENFVVNSLHDEPAESWKEKRLRELELKYDTRRNELEAKIDRLNRESLLLIDKAKEKAKCLTAFIKNADTEQMQTLQYFMSGSITHFFVDSYQPKIIEWEDNEINDVDTFNGRQKMDGIKLISLFGKSNGDLSYQLFRYSDGSGSSESIYPATSYDGALAMAQAQFDRLCEGYLSGDKKDINLRLWGDIKGIKIPNKVTEKHNNAARESINVQLKKLVEQQEALEQKAQALG